MSTPMTSTQFLKQLEAWDIPHKAIHSDWATHNRAGHGPWGPVNGIVLHHTGSDDQTSMPSLLWFGRNDLPGPLCHGGITKAGLVLLSGWGRCNHAGLGDGNVFGHVVKEDYEGNLKPKTADIDGNARFYGFEIMYSGSHEMSDAQMLTATRLSAAICCWHGWTQKSVIGHSEWQPGKWDPGISKGKPYSMSAIRSQIRYEMIQGAKPVTKAKPVK